MSRSDLKSHFFGLKMFRSAWPGHLSGLIGGLDTYVKCTWSARCCKARRDKSAACDQGPRDLRRLGPAR